MTQRFDLAVAGGSVVAAGPMDRTARRPFPAACAMRSAANAAVAPLPTVCLVEQAAA